MGLTQKLGTIPLAIQTDSSNNVGIGGAANASYKLAVTGAATFSSSVTATSFISDGASSEGSIRIERDSVASNTTIGSLIFTNNNGATTYGKVFGGRNSAGDGYVALGTGISNNLYALESGNVGIGTSSPQRTFDARGAVNLSTTAPSVASTSGAYADLHLRTWSGATSSPARISVVDNWMDFVSTFTDGFRFFNYSSNGVLAERMRITSGGNVGIGTSSPATYGSINLDVNSGSGGSAYIVARASGNSIITELVSDGEGYVGTKTNHNLNIRTNDTARIIIANNGYIRLNNIVYGNTVNTSPRTLYIESGTGSLGGISSIRASKKNIENVSNVDWIYQLNPVTFNYRKKDEEGNYTDNSYDELFYGLIAEDTAPIADFLINYNDKEDGSKEMVGIEYPRLITPMLKAIQELKAEIQLLKNK